jgi:photosystem II stability/assembly factor-like uncharacterized protein
MSSSGQYRLFAYNNNIWGSSDYGSTWSQRHNCGVELYSASISATGQYQIVTGGFKIYYSSNYGNSFTTLATTSFNSSSSSSDDFYVYCASMSSSGQYISIGATYGSITSTSIWTCENSIANGIVNLGTYATSDIQSASGATGSIYYDETDDRVKYSNGTAWISLVSAEDSPLTGDIFTNQTIDLANFSQHWIINTSTTKTQNNFKHASISVSASGKYQIVTTQDDATQTSKSTVHISSDYGQTWTTETSIPNTSDPNYPNYTANTTSISGCGKYQAVFDTANNKLFVSSNFGTNFSNNYSPGVTSYHCMSSSGKYHYLIPRNTDTNISSKIYRSTDYGVTWSATTVVTNAGIDPKSIATSSGGQYVSFIASSYIYNSNDYGFTWSTASVSFGTYSFIAMSSSGQYRLVSATGIYGSSDYGITWSERYSDSAELYGASISANGQYQIVTGFGIICYSSNHGHSFSTITSLSTNSFFSNYNFNCVSMSSSGQYISLGASLYGSTTSIWNCQNSIENGIVKLGTYATSDIQSASGVTGSIYYDTSDNIVKYSNGSSWLGISQSIQVISGSSTLSVKSGSTIVITGNSSFTITLSNTSLPYNGQTFYFRKTFTSGSNPTITFSWSNMTVVNLSNSTLTTGADLFTSASTAAVELKLLYYSSTWYICST